MSQARREKRKNKRLAISEVDLMSREDLLNIYANVLNLDVGENPLTKNMKLMLKEIIKNMKHSNTELETKD